MKIEKLDNYGRGITYLDSKICFVYEALKEEDVDIELIVNKAKYSEARVIKINKESINRVKPKCKYYQMCGSCHLMHMNNCQQKKFKIDKTIDIIYKFAKQKVNIDKLESANFLNYRNKVTLHVEGNELGYYEAKSNKLMNIDKCLLLDTKINELIKILNKNLVENDLVKTITIKLGNKTQELMLILDKKMINYRNLLKYVDVLIMENKYYTDKKVITSFICNKKYIIRKDSFFQINSIITEKMYEEILKIIKQVKAINVLDLYCGSGTIGIYIASSVKKVIGIEVVKDAIKDAEDNKKLNKVDNISFILGKVEDKISEIKDYYDTIIVDPPRSGLDKKTIEVLLKMKPTNLIYVSCDQVTFARDINLLSSIYQIDFIKLFDMFPNTYHVESVCLLSRKN